MASEKDYAQIATDGEEKTSQMLEVELKDVQQDTLPSPVSAQTQRSKPKISAAAIIPVWIVLSSSVIIYNNYLYNTLEFKFPVFLVTWHLTFAVRVRPSNTDLPAVLKQPSRPLELVFCNERHPSSMAQKMFTSLRTCSCGLSCL